MERIIDTNYAVTSGNIFEVRNNGALRFAVSYSGAIFGTSFTFPDLTLSGNLQVEGNSIIGNAVGDTLTVNATSTFKEATTFEETITAQAALGISGVITSSNTTSTNISTASIVTAGGIGVAKDIFVGEDLDVNGATTLNTLNTSGNTSIAGNLEVLGTTTLKNVVTVQSSELDVDDASITLGNVVAITGLTGTIVGTTSPITVTGVSDISGLIPGTTLIKQSGTGSFGANARISSIDTTTKTLTVTTTTASTAGAMKSDRINVIETPETHLLVIGFGILIAVISSWSPARKATSYVPVSILRGDIGV